MEKKLTSLLLDNELDMRMRLRHALSLNADFGRDLQSSNCEEALELLKQEQKSVDLVFISKTNLSFDQIRDFICEARELIGAQYAAFVVVFSSYAGRDELIARVYDVGGDSYIFEPYSADDFCRMANLAVRIGPRRLIDREVLSIEPMVRELVKLIDLMHRLAVMNCSIDKSRERLNLLGTRLAAFQEESKEVYYDYIEQYLPLQPAPEPELAQLKQGAFRSARLQKRIEETLLNAPEKRAQREAEIRRRLPPIRSRS